jgi:molybdate transport system substrate-binding protein
LNRVRVRRWTAPLVFALQIDRYVWTIIAKDRAMWRLTATAIVLTIMAGTAHADELVVYGAGSLREAVGQIASEFSLSHSLTVKTQFGPSGRMREWIETGDHVDLFTSADIGHPAKLVQDGWASVMTVFVRNTICALSPAKFGATTETLLDKLLAPGIHVGMSPSKIDPLGDYTVRLLALIDQFAPAARAPSSPARSSSTPHPDRHRQIPATLMPTPSWMGE